MFLSNITIKADGNLTVCRFVKGAMGRSLSQFRVKAQCCGVFLFKSKGLAYPEEKISL